MQGYRGPAGTRRGTLSRRQRAARASDPPRFPLSILPFPQVPGGPKMEADRRIRTMMDRIVNMQVGGCWGGGFGAGLGL
jgi:hypothetical protein